MADHDGPSDSVLRRIEGFARTSHDTGYEAGYVDAYRETRRALARKSLVYLLLGLLLGGTIVLFSTQRGLIGNSNPPPAPDPVSLGAELGTRFRAPADFAKEFTVSIQAERPGGWLRGTESVGSGSGFIYNDEGYIVTNHHVVKDGNTYSVTWRGLYYSATLVGHAPKADVAVLQINARGLKPAAMLEEGQQVSLAEEVLAIGSPFGLDHSVTSGIVSYVGRRLADGTGIGYIQTDCAINRGNSGGPLVNLQGRVVGMNRMILSQGGDSSGVGFAIPIAEVRKYADAIIQKATTSGQKSAPSSGGGTDFSVAWIGVRASDSVRGATRGVEVDQVSPNSPAATAGLRPGDVIIGIDDQPVRSLSELKQILVWQYLPGEEVTIHIRRGNETLAPKLRLGTLQLR